MRVLGAAMEEELGVAPAPSGARVRHIKKRALKNKALSVSFDEKDLRDFVTGFHKRKKKRRKEAHQKLEEAQRRKRIEARKKRKLEREFVLFGGAPGEMGPGSDEGGDNSEQDEESKPIPSVSVEGTTMYDTGDMRVTVTTCEISHEEESPCGGPQAAIHRSIVGDAKKHHNFPVNKKKPFKRVVNKARKRPQHERERSKGKKKNKKH